MKSERAYISHLLIIKLATDEERRNEKRNEKARRNAGKGMTMLWDDERSK